MGSRRRVCQICPKMLRKCHRLSSPASIATIGHTQLWSTGNVERCGSETKTFKLEGGGHFRRGIFVTPLKGREEEGRGAEVEAAAPGLLLWGLGRTKGKRGSGHEGGRWGRIQGKPEIFQLLPNKTCF